MPLDSKYNWIREYTKLLTNFKNLRPKISKMQLKKERIMKNVDELYKKKCNAYKNDYDNDDELNKAKKKNFDYKQFELGDKKDEESKLTALTKRLRSKDDFNKAIKLIEDISADTINVKSSSRDKKVFIDLDKLINDINNKKTTK